MESDSLLNVSDNSNNIEQTNNQNDGSNDQENSTSKSHETDIETNISAREIETSRSHFYGIMEFHIETYKTPVFKEELTIEAMDKVGVTPEDLVKLSPDQMKNIPGNSQTKARIINEIEKKRLNIINQIKIARKELIEEKEKKEHFDKKYRTKNLDIFAEDKKNLDRIQKAQKREIERLIAAEYIQMETKEEDLQRQKRLEAMSKEQEEKNKQKHEEEVKKRKIREEKVINRIKEKEEEIEKIKEKQREDEIQQANERKKEYQRQEQLKEIRLKKLKEDRER